MWERGTGHIWLIKGLIIALVLSYQQWGSLSVSNELNELAGAFGYGKVLLFALLVYALLLALPYFPGLEVGLAIMVFFGKPGIVFAYVATLIGLTIAFLAGKRMQKHNLEGHGLYRIFKSDLTTRLANTSPFLALIMLVNTPGNIVLGGGGGIALNYGMSKQLSLASFMLAIAIGVAPLPLLMLLGYLL